MIVKLMKFFKSLSMYFNELLYLGLYNLCLFELIATIKGCAHTLASRKGTQPFTIRSVYLQMINTIIHPV